MHINKIKIIKISFLLSFFALALLIIYQNSSISSKAAKPLFNNATEIPLEYKIIKASNNIQNSKSLINSHGYTSWETSYGDYGSSRFSNSIQINKKNLENLELAWEFSTDDHDGQIQATPVIIQDKLFAVTGMLEISCFNIKTGKVLWKYQSSIGPIAQRGMTWKKLNGAGLLFFGAGSRLYALNSETGKLFEGFGNKGSIETQSKGLKTAPLIHNNSIIFAGVDPPFLYSVDLLSGNYNWISGLHDDLVEGGNPWAGISLDNDRSMVFVSTGNPHPDFIGVERPGDNKDSNSIIAFETKNGKKIWSFQEIKHDIWDLDIASPPILTSIKYKSDKKFDVVLVPTKSGNTLILDRENGKPIFDFRLRRTQKSNIDGEFLSSYQPDLLLPEPFSKQNFELSDVTNISTESRDYVLSELKNKNFGFYKPHQVNVSQIYFGIHGGASWPGASVNHNTQTMFVASNHIPWIITVVDPETYNFSFKKQILRIKTTATTFLKKIYSTYILGNNKIVKKIQPNDFFQNTAYIDNCQACHGSNSANRIAPSLVNISSKHGYSEFKNIIKNGYGGMSGLNDISSIEISSLGSVFYTNEEIQKSKSSYELLEWQQFKDKEGFPASKPPWGSLSAIDLNSGKIKWKVPLGNIKELSLKGMERTGTENIGGPTSTSSGLVFVSGTKDELIRAFDSSNGEELWNYKIPYVGTSAPALVEIDNKPYLVIIGSGGGKLTRFDKTVRQGFSISVFSID